MAKSQGSSFWKWALGLSGLGVATYLLWPSATDNTGTPALPAPDGGSPPPPDNSPDLSISQNQSVASYTVQPNDSLSLIARKVWQDDVDNSGENYDAAELWLLLWSVNRDVIENPNVVLPDQDLQVPTLSTFSLADVANARKHYLNWKSYSF